MAVGEFRQPGRRRPYRQIERRYVLEYVLNRFPNRLWAGFNVRLGPPPEVMRKMYPDVPPSHFKVWQPWVDAIVVTPQYLYVIEAKIRNPRMAIGQLLDYAERVPYTPELARWLPREIIKLLVIPFRDPMIVDLCRKYGIQVDVYRPQWVIDYMREVGLIP